MLGRLAPDGESLPLTRSTRLVGLAPLAWVVAAVVVAVGLWAGGQVLAFEVYRPAHVSIAVSPNATLRPDADIRVADAGFGVGEPVVRLFRTDVGPNGGLQGREQPVAVQVKAVDEHTWQVVAADGGALLRPDGAYRLESSIVAPQPWLPTPRQQTIAQQVSFDTVAGPHGVLPSTDFKPKWAQPVAIPWSMPMDSITVSAQPVVPTRTWVDQKDPTRVWLQVGGDNGQGLTDGQTYDVSVTGARSRDGLDMQHPLSLRVTVPARPKLLDVPTDPVTLAYGESTSLKASLPLTGIKTSTDGDLPVSVTLDGSQIRIVPTDYQQGAQATVTIQGATSADGAPLAAPATVELQTPDAFAAPTLAPADGSAGINPHAKVSVKFDAPVADQQAAEKALQISPAVAGKWQWTAPDRAEFTPTNGFPYQTRMTLTVHGGQDGPRSADGGYLEGDTSTQFTIMPNKRLDVSLSHQTMSLIQDGVVVMTIPVATGVAAAPTPPGEYAVQYKSPQMRFQGYNPDGSHYDIPDVHWVMPFYGDYTIHGAYWRPRFGVPGSDGCVSMSDANAKVVYDWTPVGTPVSIHA